jgi:hypothetical protein
VRTVIGRVHGENGTREAYRRLLDGGFAPGSVEVQGAIGAAWRSLVWRSAPWKPLMHLRWGDSLVIVRTADEHAPRAATILQAAGGADVIMRPVPLRHRY